MFFKMHESLHFNLLYPRNKACNTQMNNSNILVKSDIDHLVSLQHSDPGFFVLSLFSFIKGYLRNRDDLSCEQATFGELVTLIREDLKASRYLSAQNFSISQHFGFRSHDRKPGEAFFLTNFWRRADCVCVPSQAVCPA